MHLHVEGSNWQERKKRQKTGRVLCSTEAWEVSLVLALCQTLVGDAFPLFLSRCATCVKGTKEKKIRNLGKENGPLSATKTPPPNPFDLCSAGTAGQGPHSVQAGISVMAL